MNNRLEQARIIPLPGTESLASKISATSGIPIIHPVYTRFKDGDGKMGLNRIGLESDIRDKILFVLSDPYNYGEKYMFRGEMRETSPDEHQKNLERLLNVTSGKELMTYIVQPLGYEFRQDKKYSENEEDESLDMTIAIDNIKRISRKLQGYITIDPHNPPVFQNILSGYESIYLHPTVPTLQQIIQDLTIEELLNVLFMGPDGGAANRARIFADLMDQSPFSSFYKRRDHTTKDRVKQHVYTGNPEDVAGKCVIVPDDIIATGSTMLKVAKECHEMKAKKIILLSSHATLTEGGEPFDRAFQEGYFHKAYNTNLSYVPESIKNRQWYKEVDCSHMLANIIKCICTGGDRTANITRQSEQELSQEIRELKGSVA